MGRNRKNKPFFENVLITDIGAEGMAIAKVDDLLAASPETIYADEAVFLKGNAYMALNQNDNALKTFNDILIKFPRSILLQEVREKIRKLRMYNKL